MFRNMVDRAPFARGKQSKTKQNAPYLYTIEQVKSTISINCTEEGSRWVQGHSSRSSSNSKGWGGQEELGCYHGCRPVLASVGNLLPNASDSQLFRISSSLKTALLEVYQNGGCCSDILADSDRVATWQLVATWHEGNCQAP
jgi:hypothetical protein